MKRFWRHLEDLWPRRIYSSWSRLLEDVWLRGIYSSWLGCFEDVLKTSSEDKDERRLHQDECLLGYFQWKSKFTYYPSKIRLQDCSKLAINQKNDNGVTIAQNDVIVNFFDVILFLLSILVTGPSFISILSLFLELWQFSLIRVHQNSGNWKYPRLSFAQYLEIGAS